MVNSFKKSIQFLAILIFLILNYSVLFAVHWSADTPITLSGTYTRFVPKGSIVSLTANAEDRDKYTENNNLYNIYSNSPWKCYLEKIAIRRSMGVIGK